MTFTPAPQLNPGSHDGCRAGDHDVTYTYDRVPCAAAPFPFSTREFARLMVLRSNVQAGIACRDDGFLVRLISQRA